MDLSECFSFIWHKIHSYFGSNSENISEPRLYKDNRLFQENRCKTQIVSTNLELISGPDIWHCDPSESLTHWGRVTHIGVCDLTSIVSDNGLSPSRRQAIIWTNAGILLIGPLGTNFSENLFRIQIFSFKKMHLKMSSGKCRPFGLGLNVLRGWEDSYRIDTCINMFDCCSPSSTLV